MVGTKWKQKLGPGHLEKQPRLLQLCCKDINKSEQQKSVISEDNLLQAGQQESKELTLKAKVEVYLTLKPLGSTRCY